MEIVFALDPESVSADHLARFALAAFDGAFVAHQSHPEVTIAELLEHLPAALAAVRRELGRAGRSWRGRSINRRSVAPGEVIRHHAVHVI
jgi:hypothetical protein